MAKKFDLYEKYKARLPSSHKEKIEEIQKVCLAAIESKPSKINLTYAEALKIKPKKESEVNGGETEKGC